VAVGPIVLELGYLVVLAAVATPEVAQPFNQLRRLEDLGMLVR
jgi:hypothetical protein